MSLAKIAKLFRPYSFSFCLTFSQLREQEPFEDLTKDLKKNTHAQFFFEFQVLANSHFYFYIIYPWTTQAKLVQFYIDIINFGFFSRMNENDLS